MKKTDICRICDNFDVGRKCDNEDKCILIAMQKENTELKKQVAELKKELADTKRKMSYMVNPDAIGSRNDMGW